MSQHNAPRSSRPASTSKQTSTTRTMGGAPTSSGPTTIRAAPQYEQFTAATVQFGTSTTHYSKAQARRQYNVALRQADIVYDQTLKDIQEAYHNHVRLSRNEQERNSAREWRNTARQVADEQRSAAKRNARYLFHYYMK